MIEIRPYKLEDYLAIDSFQDLMGAKKEDRIGIGKKYESSGINFSLFINGICYGCFGFIMLWGGGAEAWAFIDKKISFRGLVEGKIAFLKIADEYNLKRIQAITRSDWKEGRRFLEWIGMDYEGTLRKFGPNGIDQVIYARIR